jgi:hypothetical protein
VRLRLWAAIISVCSAYGDSISDASLTGIFKAAIGLVSMWIYQVVDKFKAAIGRVCGYIRFRRCLDSYLLLCSTVLHSTNNCQCVYINIGST